MDGKYLEYYFLNVDIYAVAQNAMCIQVYTKWNEIKGSWTCGVKHCKYKISDNVVFCQILILVDLVNHEIYENSTHE